MANFGISFFPGQTQGGPRPAQPSAQPLQEAIRILSLRLPRGAPGQALAPPGLLEAPGQGMAPQTLMAILQRLLMDPRMPAGMPSQLPGGLPGGAPSPHIIPGAQAPHLPLPGGASPAPRYRIPIPDFPQPPGGPAPSLGFDQPAASHRYGDWMNTERRLNQRPIFRGVKKY